MARINAGPAAGLETSTPTSTAEAGLGAQASAEMGFLAHGQGQGQARGGWAGTLKPVHASQYQNF